MAVDWPQVDRLLESGKEDERLHEWAQRQFKFHLDCVKREPYLLPPLVDALDFLDRVMFRIRHEKYKREGCELLDTTSPDDIP